MHMLIFIFGTIFGSFLNVCIYRLPKKQSLIYPGSACPNCHKPIPFYYNLPLVGYLLLRGKCHNCKGKIPFQYFAVELFAGLISVFNFIQFGFQTSFFAFTILSYGLIVVTMIDLKTHLILNNVLITLLGFGVVLNVFLPFLVWTEAMLGLLVGGASMFLIAILGQALFKKESLGMGDVKLAAVVGFFMGWLHVLLAIYFGFLFAFLSLVFMGRLRTQKKAGHTPLGPFLSFSFMVFIYWGNDLLQFYVSQFLR